MAHRPNESDLLAWIEGEPLAAERADEMRDAFERDPDLKRWAEAARTDRARLRALAEIEAAGAPAGLAATAMELAEREWLVGDAFEPRRQSRRIRITPVRFVAAASVVIIAGAASLIGFLVGPPANQPQNQFFAHAPEGESEADKRLAMAKPTEIGRATLSGGRVSEAAITGPEPTSGILSLTDHVADQVAAAGADSSQFSEARRLAETSQESAPPSAPARFAAAPAQGGLTFRMIHPAEHAPEHAVAPDRAAELVRDGRLLLLIRTADPAGVEQALLSRASGAASAARWRSILELGGAGEGASPGSEAARVALVDVFATPASLEQLIAEVTTANLSTEGAWLQEMADSVRLEPRFETEDLFFWNRPTSAWAPRTTLPVLIERVAPERDDASRGPDSTP